MLLGWEAKEANLLALEGFQTMRLGEALLRGVELQGIAIRPGGKHPSRTNNGQPKGFGVPVREDFQIKNHLYIGYTLILELTGTFRRHCDCKSNAWSLCSGPS